MAFKNYGVLKGKVLESKRDKDMSTPHYKIHIQAGETHYCVPVNVRSSIKPPDLRYLLDDNFLHPITSTLQDSPIGFSKLLSKPGGQALDYIRANLFDESKLRVLPGNIEGENNDLSDIIEVYVNKAILEKDALMYAFGDCWGPDKSETNSDFNFKPDNGVHVIHMNQGNEGEFVKDDGVWQDGALIFYYPSSQQWVALFLAFQSQCWHTDDKTGHCTIHPAVTEGIIRIVGAVVNPYKAQNKEIETVTLLNTSPDAINLTGWKIADKLKNKYALSSTIEAGAALKITLSSAVQLGDNGGIITLLDNNGLKIDGVSYTKEQAQKEGWTIVF